MGGFEIEDEHGNTVVGYNLPVQNVLMRAFVDAGLSAWERAGFYCPDCFYQKVTKASVVRSFEAALACVEATSTWSGGIPDHRWHGGGTDRDVALEALKAGLVAIRAAEGETFVIQDDFLMCEHESLVQG